MRIQGDTHVIVQSVNRVYRQTLYMAKVYKLSYAISGTAAMASVIRKIQTTFVACKRDWYVGKK